jgi:hypothetical protein
VVGIKEFPYLIYNRKIRGPSPRCGGPVARSGPRWTIGCLAGGRRAGARAHRTSPAGRNREGGRTRGTRWVAHRGAGGSVAAGRRRRLELIARVKEGAKGLGREGKRCNEVWGWCSPFIGVGACRGGVAGG